MSNYTARQLLGLAQHVHFPADEQARAVAVALTFSAGNPGRHHVDTSNGVRDYRGLWGVRRDLITADPPPDLFDPASNAYYAHALWAAHGGSWRWTPAVDSPMFGWHLAVANAAVDLGPARLVLPADPPPSPPTIGLPLRPAGRSPVRSAFDAAARSLADRARK